MLGIEQAATAFNVKTEDYPLARRLYIFTPFPLEGYARQFENFIAADDRADDLLSLPPAIDDRLESQGGMFDQKIEAMPDDHPNSLNARETKADRASLERFGDISTRGQRLSITYRFSSGSDQLDTKARQDIRRLARYLQNTRTRPTGLLAGFTDDVGSVSANLGLAARRAELSDDIEHLASGDERGRLHLRLQVKGRVPRRDVRRRTRSWRSDCGPSPFGSRFAGRRPAAPPTAGPPGSSPLPIARADPGRNS